MAEKNLDMCNNAVPTDYNKIRIKYIKVEDDRMDLDDENLMDNEFAPALYYLMSHREKLKSPSYVSYNSGFIKEGGRKFGSNQTIDLEEYDVTIRDEYKDSESSETVASEPEMRMNVSDNTNKRVAYPKTSKAAFERYVDLLDALK